MQMLNRYFKRLLVFVFPFLFSSVYSFGQISNYPFLNIDKNFIEFQNIDLTPLISKISNKESRFVIAHFGDSHIQPDYYTGYLRKTFQSIHGDGGRGMVFPYSIAKTYSQADFKSSFKGKWVSSNSINSNPKIPLGVSGFSASTNDTSASFKIVFTHSINISNISLLISNENNQYEIALNTGRILQDPFSQKLSAKTSRLDYTVNGSLDSLEFVFNRITVGSDSLFVRGVYFENNTGLIYNNFGVGGAAFESLLKQRYFEEEIKSVNPDLVILDWGANDILYTNCIDLNLPSTITRTIERVRKVLPNATIMLTSVQDMNRKGINITSAIQFSKLIRKIAFDNNCLLYDWFNISGGNTGMIHWVDNQLARPDNIHLTKLGYELKGQLFYSAFTNTLDSIKSSKGLMLLKLENPISSFDSLNLRDCSKIVIKPIKRIVVSKSRKSIKKKGKVAPKKKKIVKPVKSTKKKSIKKKK
jgi:hypothetical protein